MNPAAQTYQLGSDAKLLAIDPLPGQSKDVTYACLRRGLPMPADGIAYVVEVADMAAEAKTVQVVGYVDRFARAFAVDGVLTMPPAVTPDLQLKRYADSVAEKAALGTAPGAKPEAVESGAMSRHASKKRRPDASETAATPSQRRGCVEIYAADVKQSYNGDEQSYGSDANNGSGAIDSLGDSSSTGDAGAISSPSVRPWRVAEFVMDANDVVTFSDARVHLGTNDRPLPFAQAVSVAFVAFCLVPRSQHVSLSMLSVSDVFDCLASQDFFEDVNQILKSIGKAAKHPLLNPPGILLYLAHLLRATGVEGKGPADIVNNDQQPLMTGDLTWIPSDGSAPVSLAVPVAQQEARQLPEVYLVRTTDYADLFYVAFRRDLVSEQGAHMLVEIEGILNRFLLMAQKLQERGMLETATQAQCAQLDRWIVEDILAQSYDRARELAAGDDGRHGQQNGDDRQPDDDGKQSGDDKQPDADGPDSDLEIRIMFAQACESLVLPFRLDYRMRLNAQSDHLYVDAVAPDVTVMPHDAFDAQARDWKSLSEDDRQAAEARYAAHLATLIAMAGFGASDLVTSVTANIWRASRKTDVSNAATAMDQTCELSVCFERDKFRELLQAHDGAWLASGSDDARPWFAREPFDLVRQMRHAYSMGTGFELVGTPPLTSLDAVTQAYDDVSSPSDDSDAAACEHGSADTHDASPDASGVLGHAPDVGFFDPSGLAAIGADSKGPLMAIEGAFDALDAGGDSGDSDDGADDEDDSDDADDDATVNIDITPGAGVAGLVADLGIDAGAAGNLASDAGAASADDGAADDDGSNSGDAGDADSSDASADSANQGVDISTILNAVAGLGSMLGAGSPVNPIETDEHPFDEAGSKLLIARRVRDMGIYEDTPRRELAREAMTALKRGGMTPAISTLRDIHDRTENQLVKAACLSVSDGIVNDRITADSAEEIDRAFADVYGLRSDMREASKLIRSNPGRAVELLNGIVNRVDKAGWFVDTDTRVYRYFDCYASRALYAGRCKGDLRDRELRLTSDEYYLAHHRLAAILSNSVGQAEEAIAHAQRCVELGPSASTSYLRLARCYFATFDYASEIETLRDMLRIAWNPTDIGMALYWLGYAFWMTDEKRVGMACYQRCGSYDQNIIEPASAELSNFLAKESDMPEYLEEEEVDELLKSAGIDLDLPVKNAGFLVQGADAALRAKSQRLGFNLLGSAAAMLHDDALTPVIESISA